MARYDTKEILKSTNRKQYYRGKFYPNIPLSADDSYVVTTVGDRLTNGSIFPIPGTQLRIPADLNGILNLFNTFNQAR